LLVLVKLLFISQVISKRR